MSFGPSFYVELVKDSTLKVDTFAKHTVATWQENLAKLIVARTRFAVADFLGWAEAKLESICEDNAAAVIRMPLSLALCAETRLSSASVSCWCNEYRIAYPNASKGDDIKALTRVLPEELRSRIDQFENEHGVDAFQKIIMSDRPRGLRLLAGWLDLAVVARDLQQATNRANAAAAAARVTVRSNMNTPKAPAAALAPVQLAPATEAQHCLKCNLEGHLRENCKQYKCCGCDKWHPGHLWRKCPESPFPRRKDGTLALGHGLQASQGNEQEGE